MRRAILLSAILALVVSATALAAGPPNPSGTRLVAGGARIWEGASPARAAADIVFSGFTSKIGPGPTAADYRCEWQVRFLDVSVDWLDGATARMTGCQHVYVNTTADTTGTVGYAEVDGVAGYWLTLIFAWHDGQIDQVRILLRPAGSEPGDAIWDTPRDFTVAEAARTPIDAGQIQSWIDD